MAAAAADDDEQIEQHFVIESLIERETVGTVAEIRTYRIHVLSVLLLLCVRNVLL